MANHHQTADNLKRKNSINNDFKELGFDFSIDDLQQINKTKSQKWNLYYNRELLPEHEYECSRIVTNMHKSYEHKFNELFHTRYSPKDSLNRFLYEQLSLENKKTQNSSLTQTMIYDEKLPEPENIFKLDTLEKEIKTALPLTCKLSSLKGIKWKIIKNIKESIEMGKRFSIQNKMKTFNEQNKFKMLLAESNRLNDMELFDKFKKEHADYSKLFYNLIDEKIKELKIFMNEDLKKVSTQLNKIYDSKIIKDEHNKVTIIKRAVDNFVLIKYKDLEFKISEFHYEKLKRLYKSTHNNNNNNNNIKASDDDDDDDDDNDDEEKSLFESRLFILVCRYQKYFKNNDLINEGYGMQASLPSTVFKELNEMFCVTEEMFASPFNCYFNRYCSAFLDTDVHFGSNGSFFEYEPTYGSFECNPPFTEEVIERMADRIESLLDKNNEKTPLSFIVFIPEWLDPPTPGLVKMQKSKYLRIQFSLEGGKHNYISGSQHINTTKKNSYLASHNTKVFVLQNQAGFNKWTPTKEKIDKIKISMNFLNFEFSQNYDVESTLNKKLKR